ncbi:MAG: FliM/FliN family flagellar motor switch protein [Vulcanimicrobiaceae bacterium]
MIASQGPNLELLLGVVLEVTADIGSTPMSVQQILALGPGSVVEFRRTVDQPIDLKVNGTVIARGEIVAVDGRFGLRITELIANVAA